MKATCSVYALRWFTYQSALELVGEPSVKTTATLVELVTAAYLEHLSVCLLAFFPCFAICRAIHHRVHCMAPAEPVSIILLYKTHFMSMKMYIILDCRVWCLPGQTHVKVKLCTYCMLWIVDVCVHSMACQMRGGFVHHYVLSSFHRCALDVAGLSLGRRLAPSGQLLEPSFRLFKTILSP